MLKLLKHSLYKYIYIYRKLQRLAHKGTQIINNYLLIPAGPIVDQCIQWSSWVSPDSSKKSGKTTAAYESLRWENVDWHQNCIWIGKNGAKPFKKHMGGYHGDDEAVSKNSPKPGVLTAVPIRCYRNLPPDGSKSHTTQVAIIYQFNSKTQKHQKHFKNLVYLSLFWTARLPRVPEVKYATETSRWESMCRSHDRVMTTYQGPVKRRPPSLGAGRKRLDSEAISGGVWGVMEKSYG